MILNIFSVFDSKAEAFMSPFFMNSKGSAIRAFTEISHDKTHAFGKNPEDFTLFHLGSWNDSSASFDLLATPASLGLAIEFIKT